MHILITGAAGMIGRKLTERLVVDRALNGQPIEKLTLIDIVAPARPAGFSDHVKTRDRRSRRSRPSPTKAVSERPDVIFHLAGVVSGEAELNFEKGYHVNLDGTRVAARSDPQDRRRLQAARDLHLVDGGVRRAVPARHPRRIPSDAADLLRHAEGDVRADARRLHAQGHPRRRRHPAAVDRGAAGQAEQGRVRASSPASSASRSTGEEAQLPVADTVVHTHASPRSAIGFLIHAAGLPRDKIEPRINLTMPGVCCTVAEQIEALRRIAGDKVAARIRREPDELIVRIVAGWPHRFEAKRATELGFRAESSFDEIIRVHIDEDLGGKFVKSSGTGFRTRSVQHSHALPCSADPGDAGQALQALPRRRGAAGRHDHHRACRQSRRDDRASQRPARGCGCRSRTIRAASCRIAGS